MGATIDDVAARSGVSTATVSRVLSGSVPARAATRERVLAAARELDYRPSSIARALKRQETRTLGLLVTDITNPFYPQIVRAVEAAAHERGYGIVLANGGDDAARELEHLDLLIERRVDGIVIVSSRMTRRHAERLHRTAVPVVLVNDTVAGSGLPTVTTAHRRGARLAAEHLIQLGHQRIAHIGAPADQAASGQRRQGVRDAMRRAGLGEPLIAIGDGGVAGGAHAAEALIDSDITGIVAYNDLTAIGALRALRRAGIGVPEAVSVVGFDDIDLAAWTDPPLTTIRQPTEALGRWAVEHVADLLAGHDDGLGISPVLLDPEIVVRDSTSARGTV
ncbi:MAG: LacI family DNA-binding transcriptional regulator [Chloroflexi bacterium]|nr:LacI family DNA-binding transcriptional regulator [Chloroflexota bacterium]